jgi:hypothetical protein
MIMSANHGFATPCAPAEVGQQSLKETPVPTGDAPLTLNS